MSENVYRALADAPFGQSVEYFVMPRPTSSRTKLFFNDRTFTRCFPNLKRYVLS